MAMMKDLRPYITNRLTVGDFRTLITIYKPKHCEHSQFRERFDKSWQAYVKIEVVKNMAVTDTALSMHLQEKRVFTAIG
jgi:hypothetical protein